MPSFDVVSELDMHEVSNAVDQANREIANRFDFKGVDAKYAMADMDAHFPRDATRRARQAQQKRGENPVGQRPLAVVEQRPGKVIESALTVFIFTAVAFQSGLGVVRPPRSDVIALTPGTLERAIFPAQRMERGVTRFGVEELVQMRHNRHG